MENLTGIKIPYVRYAKNEGNFVVEKTLLTEDQKNDVRYFIYLGKITRFFLDFIKRL